MNKSEKGRLKLMILRVIVYIILIFLCVLCLFFFLPRGVFADGE